MPEPEHCGIESAAEDVEHVLDPGLPVRGQPPQVGAADHHRARTERESLGDIAAAPDPAVEEHLDLIAHRRRDGREHANRTGRPVEVVSAVIGHRDRRDPRIDRPFRVIDPCHALQHERATPLFAKPRDILPGGRRRLHPLVIRAEEGGRGLPRRGQVRGGQVGDVPRPRIGQQPRGMGQNVRREVDQMSRKVSHLVAAGEIP